MLALQFASLYYNRRNAVFLCLCRNTADLLAMVERLTERGVVVQFHKEDFKTGKNSPAGNMMLTVLAAVAQMERETMLERQREGYEAAKAPHNCKLTDPYHSVPLRGSHRPRNGGFFVVFVRKLFICIEGRIGDCV
ncbi:recombinase family protein [Enterobacter sp.]|uniref:recombinase family protein n=1 Tax=Enterobacter sp. TaxID=42895 RepID=UPI00290BAED0|nr:recombinase family protein [Enterobacter sp.]MDU5078493.1 recombinase family protein [Enterobacter sp.]